MVFLSKCLAMLPVIWTDDDAESDCKSYFNLYTFVVFLAWIGNGILNQIEIITEDIFIIIRRGCHLRVPG